MGGRFYIVTCEDVLTNSAVTEESEVWPDGPDPAPAESGGDNPVSIPSFESADPISHATDAVVGDKTFCKGGFGTIKLDPPATNKTDSVLSAGVSSEATDCDVCKTCGDCFPGPINSKI